VTQLQLTRITSPTAQRDSRWRRNMPRGAAPFGAAYVIGTEAPSPRGASHDLQTIEITRPEAALRTIAVHKAAFIGRRVGDAFTRIVVLVVQPGVEFDHAHLAAFDPDRRERWAASIGRSLPRETDKARQGAQ
jgi:D-tagatose 6-phosphate 4-epimerase